MELGLKYLMNKRVTFELAIENDAGWHTETRTGVFIGTILKPLQCYSDTEISYFTNAVIVEYETSHIRVCQVDSLILLEE